MTAISGNVPTYTLAEVRQHSTEGDAWIVIAGKVYDISTFKHPGLNLFVSRAGKDVTDFFKFRHGDQPEKLEKLEKEFFIGYLSR